MAFYRVKYILEEVVNIEANNPEEAAQKATLVQDFDYNFFRDEYVVEELQDKSITTVMYIKGQGTTHFDKKVVKDLPDENKEFHNVESLEFLQLEKDFIELRLTSFNLSIIEILDLAERICQNKLSV